MKKNTPAINDRVFEPATALSSRLLTAPATPMRRRRSHANDLTACGLAMFFLFAATLLAGDNLAVNGSFEDGINGWQFAWSTDRETPPAILPEQLAIVEQKEGGAVLRITFPEVQEADLHWSHTNGVLLKLVSAIPTESKMLVKLKARSVSGATCLTINRPCNGASGVIAQLNSDWKTIEAKLDLAFDTAQVMFSLTDKIPSEILTWEGAGEVSEGIYSMPIRYAQHPVQEGVVEIKDVSVEEVPPQ